MLSFFLSVSVVTARNILLVTTDDMTSTVFDNYSNNFGNNFGPNSFFDSANVFNAITSQPVCGPARAALLTGLRPDSSLIYNFETPLIRPNMFSYFKSKGYETFVAGKIFHTLPSDQRKQFEFNLGYLTQPRVCVSGGNNGCPNLFFCNVKNSEDQCSMNAIKNFFSSRVGKSGNWIAGIGFHRPHLQISIKSKKRSQLCKRYVNTMNFRTVGHTSLSNFQNPEAMYMRVPINGVYTKMNANGRNFPFKFFIRKYEKTVKLMRQAYCDSSTETIYNFLHIVDSLYKILPQSRNDTDIVFVADHGFQIGQRSILGKNTLYPEATNIPLFFKIAGENTKRPIKNNYVSSIDIFPTLVQLHGHFKVPLKLDGISLFNTPQIQVPISQYPRCQQINKIQTDDCMLGKGSCFGDSGRSKITYMGYLTIKEINGKIYRFSGWYPFNEVRTCGLINNFGQWPVWNIKSAKTDFSVSYFKELYSVDKNTQLINSENLAFDPNYKQIITEMEKIITV